MARSRHRIHCRLSLRSRRNSIGPILRAVCDIIRVIHVQRPPMTATSNNIHMYVHTCATYYILCAGARCALYFVLGGREREGVRTHTVSRAAEIRVCINLKRVSIWLGRCVSEDVRCTYTRATLLRVTRNAHVAAAQPETSLSSTSR